MNTIQLYDNYHINLNKIILDNGYEIKMFDIFLLSDKNEILIIIGNDIKYEDNIKGYNIKVKNKNTGNYDQIFYTGEYLNIDGYLLDKNIFIKLYIDRKNIIDQIFHNGIDIENIF